MKISEDKWAGLATLVRPTYAPGLLLEDEDLTAAVDYTRELNRLLFRSLFGCGVICGLEVAGVKQCEGRELKITVHPGLALDCLGNPIHVPRPFDLEYAPDCNAKFPKVLWVSVCFVDTACRMREVAAPCDAAFGESRAEMTRRKDGFRFTLSTEQPSGPCACDKPKPKPGGTHGECCTDEPTDDNGRQGAETDEKRFDLYGDHAANNCACDCNCNCVLVGRLALTLEPNGTIVTKASAEDDGWVRRIRPLLYDHAREMKILPAPAGT